MLTLGPAKAAGAGTATIRLPLGTGLETVTEGDFTVETWFRTTDPGRHILLGNFSSSYKGILNLELHTDNRVRIVLQSTAGTSVDLNLSADLLGIDTRDGIWHHLAGVRAESWIGLYLDGCKVGQCRDVTATHWRTAVGPVVSDRTVTLKPESLQFAKRVDSPGTGKHPDKVDFGVISDLHYGVINWKWKGTGYVEYDYLAAFLKDMSEPRADFVIQLGDFVTPANDGQKLVDLWRGFDEPSHNVLGNHERDGGYGFDEIAKWWGMPGRYYTFDSGRLRGIVLDGNEPGGGGQGYASYVGPEQREWLKQQLADTDRPAIVFIHQPIEHGLRNGDEVRAIIEQAEATRPGTVIAVFGGHAHQDYGVTINGIPYIQINSASYHWFDKAGGPVRYAEPVWGRVTVDFDKGLLVIRGRQADWLSTNPWAHGAADGAFRLEGDSLFIGSDTRTDATRLVGAIDNVRIWKGGLRDDDVRALARGMLPADLKTRDEKPMAEYRFETSGGSPLHDGAYPAGSVDDSAGFTGGPFNGVASGIRNLLVSGNVPEPLLKTRRSGLSLRFEGEN
jgi:hypothetical protein